MPAESDRVNIRKAVEDDAAAIARLSAQLGYAGSEANTRKYLHAIFQSGRSDVFVSTVNEEITGWIYMLRTVDLTSGPFFEIAGLIVDERHRGRGTGKNLVQHVINVCKAEGAYKLRVRSQLKRKEAHLFYQGLGFSETKEQKVFDLEIN